MDVDTDDDKCSVCGTVATGKRSGSISCNSCGKFFSQTYKKKAVYECQNDGNCVITPNHDTNCKHCRYEKCKNVGMVFNNKGKPVYKCLVCTNTCIGKHFGVRSCNQCSSFYAESARDNLTFGCPQDNHCNITVSPEERCKSCWYNKCIEDGMRAENALCKICGQVATGIHYGVLACNCCRRSFQNALAKNENWRKWTCKTNGNCNLNWRFRQTANCPKCRLDKCFKEGMVLPDSNEPKKKAKLVCAVCGKTANGIRCSVVACNDCCTHFRTTVLHNIKYTCVLGGNCEIDDTPREKCQACRFAKCLEVGMKSDDIHSVYTKEDKLKHERERGRKNKTRARLELKELSEEERNQKIQEMKKQAKKWSIKGAKGKLLKWYNNLSNDSTKKDSFWESRWEALTAICETIKKEYRNTSVDKVACPKCKRVVDINRFVTHLDVHTRLSLLLGPMDFETRQEVEQLSSDATTLKKTLQQVKPGRISSSNAHSVLTAKTPDVRNRVFDRIQDTKLFVLTPSSNLKYIPVAMERGILMEPLGIDQYKKYMHLKDENMHYPTGYIGHPEEGAIGGRPDALVEDNRGKGVIELKCPVRPVSKVEFLTEASEDVGKGHYIKRGPESTSNKYMLKRSHKYYTQCLVHLMVTKRPFVDFVVYYQNDQNPTDFEVWVETIYYENVKEEIKEKTQKLVNFYKRRAADESMVPDLLEKFKVAKETNSRRVFDPSRRQYLINNPTYDGPIVTGRPEDELREFMKNENLRRRLAKAARDTATKAPTRGKTLSQEKQLKNPGRSSPMQTTMSTKVNKTSSAEKAKPSSSATAVSSRTWLSSLAIASSSKSIADTSTAGPSSSKDLTRPMRATRAKSTQNLPSRRNMPVKTKRYIDSSEEDLSDKENEEDSSEDEDDEYSEYEPNTSESESEHEYDDDDDEDMDDFLGEGLEEDQEDTNEEEYDKDEGCDRSCFSDDDSNSQMDQDFENNPEDALSQESLYESLSDNALLSQDVPCNDNDYTSDEYHTCDEGEVESVEQDPRIHETDCSNVTSLTYQHESKEPAEPNQELDEYQSDLEELMQIDAKLDEISENLKGLKVGEFEEEPQQEQYKKSFFGKIASKVSNFRDQQKKGREEKRKKMALEKQKRMEYEDSRFAEVDKQVKARMLREQSNPYYNAGFDFEGRKQMESQQKDAKREKEQQWKNMCNTTKPVQSCLTSCLIIVIPYYFISQCYL